MSNRKSFIAGVLVTLAAVFALLMLTGAVNSKTENLKSDMGINLRGTAMYVACSSDGSVVYVSDDSRIMRSKDFGANWDIVLTRRGNESPKQ